MRHEEIPDQLRNLAFDFFFRFSRFEFALKEARILKDDRVGANAEADWDGYIRAFRDQYLLSPAGKALVEARPQRQIVGEQELEFRDVAFNPGASDLEKVVRLANTVRNNLFHGGKHSVVYWDDPERMQFLLGTTITVLGDLAAQTGLAADYERYY
jgi:hypothetical protein